MIPLRLAIDTNIVVSAALKPEACSAPFFFWRFANPARLYVSDPILEEYREVLARPELKIRKGLREQALQLVKSHSQRVKPSRPLQITRGPDDNMFLECADAARADYLGTGNQRHFPKFWKKTKVITSREFIGIVAPHLIPQTSGNPRLLPLRAHGQTSDRLIRRQDVLRGTSPNGYPSNRQNTQLILGCAFSEKS